MIPVVRIEHQPAADPDRLVRVNPRGYPECDVLVGTAGVEASSYSVEFPIELIADRFSFLLSGKVLGALGA